MPLLGVIFVALITSSLPSITADEPVDNKVVSEDADKLNVVPTKDPKYKIYLHVIVRNAQGELISVADTLPCQFGRNCFEYMLHEVSDYVFDTLLGKKEIITIDNIKYEKVHHSNTLKVKIVKDQTSKWALDVCGTPLEKYGFYCATVFGTNKTTVMYLEVGDVITTNWIILRAMN